MFDERTPDQIIMVLEQDKSEEKVEEEDRGEMETDTSRNDNLCTRLYICNGSVLNRNFCMSTRSL
jgi:hypothetical protein